MMFPLNPTLRDVIYYQKRRKDDCMYTIGQLSKKTGITTRTLDYYDEINLMKPSSKTSGGHRLYNENDVMHLQQVLALKYMGFSLKEIKKHLLDSKKSWQQSIQDQIDMIQKEQERLQTLEKALQGISYSIEFEGDMNWPIVFRIIQLFQQDPKHAFHGHDEHLSSKDIQKVMQFNNDMTNEEIEEWMSSIQEIKAHIGINPASEKARNLAERWMHLAENIFGNDEELLANMWKSMETTGNTDAEGIAFYPMDEEFITFIKSVYVAHHQGE